MKPYINCHLRFTLRSNNHPYSELGKSRLTWYLMDISSWSFDPKLQRGTSLDTLNYLFITNIPITFCCYCTYKFCYLLEFAFPNSEFGLPLFSEKDFFEPGNRLRCMIQLSRLGKQSCCVSYNFCLTLFSGIVNNFLYLLLFWVIFVDVILKPAFELCQMVTFLMFGTSYSAKI